MSGWESEEAGADGVHAKTAHYLECDGEERNPMASRDGTSLYRRGLGDPGLDGDRRSYAKYVRRFFTGESENALFGS